jgi:hypothetical protein
MHDNAAARDLSGSTDDGVAANANVNINLALTNFSVVIAIKVEDQFARGLIQT